MKIEMLIDQLYLLSIYWESNSLSSHVSRKEVLFANKSDETSFELSKKHLCCNCVILNTNEEV